MGTGAVDVGPEVALRRCRLEDGVHTAVELQQSWILVERAPMTESVLADFSGIIERLICTRAAANWTTAGTNRASIFFVSEVNGHTRVAAGPAEHHVVKGFRLLRSHNFKNMQANLRQLRGRKEGGVAGVLWGSMIFPGLAPKSETRFVKQN